MASVNYETALHPWGEQGRSASCDSGGGAGEPAPLHGTTRAYSLRYSTRLVEAFVPAIIVRTK